MSSRIPALFDLNTPEEMQKNTNRRREIENRTSELPLDKLSLESDTAVSVTVSAEPSNSFRESWTAIALDGGREVQVQVEPDSGDKSVQTEHVIIVNVEAEEDGNFMPEEDELSGTKVIDGVLCKELCMAEPQDKARSTDKDHEKNTAFTNSSMA